MHNYTNMETQIVAHWLSEDLREIALDALYNAAGDVELAILDAASNMRGLLEEERDECGDTKSGMFASLIVAAIERIDYRELADVFVINTVNEYDEARRT